MSDLWAENPVRVPCHYHQTKWIDDDGLGNSMLRLIGEDFELRMLHFFRAEISEEFAALMIQGLPAQCGDVIGPAGNMGVSFGRHVHYALILAPGRFDDELIQAFGYEWDKDKLPGLVAQYGPALEQDRRARRIAWMNENVVARIDPYWGRESYQVNSVALLGL
jgi:hypothetical protein